MALSESHHDPAPRRPSGDRETRWDPDRRTQPRVTYEVGCRVRMLEPDRGHVRVDPGDTVDLSTQGLGLVMGDEVSPGTWVETLVDHPYGEPMFLSGTVVHCAPTRAGRFRVGVAAALTPTGM
jgi:hypothetical protein